jgi:hypothetical protein
MRTRYLEIWQKEEDGQWRIAIFIDNVDVPPQMPPSKVLLTLSGRAKLSQSRKGTKKTARRSPIRA